MNCYHSIGLQSSRASNSNSYRDRADTSGQAGPCLNGGAANKGSPAPTADIQLCGSSVVQCGSTTEQKITEEMFRLQGEMLMPYEEEVFLFGERNDRARTVFIENKE